MKQKLLLLCLATASFANLSSINSFEADFKQNIVDDKKKSIIYYGHVKATKPQFALWTYIKPIDKQVYILQNQAIIVEPELEQAIIKKIGNNFDFFRLIKHAKKLKENEYLARYNNTTFLIRTKSNSIQSISYKDEFENSVIIDFTNQKVNKSIDKKEFTPKIPDDYDVIRD
ncbi:LolA-like outer membrane lipoprotein chaperone [Sulfurimonas paralvinellae]|uniref:Outer membrane lipoprotein chaperone LolA n=1 Tax=Sulfurimonas paralvinellae TaxID=317658 RepID=A0A7M1B7N3_9BACT|nr:LolA-like outer membrane lipoprotein chaperone [Sulfurimonas paralvinellae]QOP45714.1 outer membrane lipoprotein chaperone LolA [Sulfurimonas paralvinellae]